MHFQPKQEPYRDGPYIQISRISVEVMRLVRQPDNSSFVQRGYDKPPSHGGYQAYEVRNMTSKTVNLCLILSFRVLGILAPCQARRDYVN